MKKTIRAALLSGALAIATGVAPLAAVGETQMPVSLFKVVTAKDEVIIGLNVNELRALGGVEKAPAGIIASALASRNELTVWQYAVSRASDGGLQVAPLRQIGLLAHDSLRVEPYSSPLKVLPHD
jgi:hypothetical protein